MLELLASKRMQKIFNLAIDMLPHYLRKH